MQQSKERKERTISELPIMFREDIQSAKENDASRI
jgi:hypothetical protein